MLFGPGARPRNEVDVYGSGGEGGGEDEGERGDMMPHPWIPAEVEFLGSMASREMMHAEPSTVNPIHMNAKGGRATGHDEGVQSVGKDRGSCVSVCLRLDHTRLP